MKIKQAETMDKIWKRRVEKGKRKRRKMRSTSYYKKGEKIRSNWTGRNQN
jgi:hypothetical protein